MKCKCGFQKESNDEVQMVALLPPWKLKKKLQWHIGNVNCLPSSAALCTVFLGAKSAPSFYFKMCLEHMNQIKLASICTKVGRFHCLVYQPANISFPYTSLCWEIAKARWNRKKNHHDLISFNYFGSYWRLCLIFCEHPFISCALLSL